MRPPVRRVPLLATLCLAMALAATLLPLPATAELFEDSGLYQDQVPPPMPSALPSTSLLSTSSLSATSTATSPTSSVAPTISTTSSSVIPASTTPTVTSTADQATPTAGPTSAPSVPAPPTVPDDSDSGTGANTEVFPPTPTDAFEYTPDKGKGKGKGLATLEPEPEPESESAPPVVVTIDNDFGVNSYEPHVPFKPHIDPQVETPMSHFHPAFGAAIPPRRKCKPRKSPFVNTTPSEAAAGEGSYSKGSGHEKRQAPPPPPPPARQPRNDMERVEFYFGQRLETNLARLPAESHFQPTPWAASYWPIFKDSLNARWAPNELPPSDKYARAFGLNVAQFRDSVSRHNGILGQSSRRPCGTNQDCRTLNDGSVCAKRDGETRGFCIPTWFGICHAWAPAAVMEPEPRCSVTRNGVTFKPFDIKALVTLLWDGARTPTVFTGNRYNGPENAAKDQFGRFQDPTYRDLNPGFMHILMTNMLGRFRKSFVVDVTGSAEVWNQPVKGYKVLEQTLMTPAAAAQRFFNTPTYRFNTRATMVASVKTRFTWVVEAGEDGPLVSTGRINQYLDSRDYTYLLELDARQNIIGGEWVGASLSDHPDFAWFPAQRPSMDVVTRVGLSYRHVRELLDESARGQC